MVECRTDHHLDLMFHALADPTRRAILNRLARHPSTVTELARPFAMSLAAVSKHLNVLEKAGLLQRHKEGRCHYCSLDAHSLQEAARVISELQAFWETSLTSLEQVLNSSSSHLPSTKEHPMTIPPLVIKKTFAAPIERLFEAWSNPDIMALWLKPSTEGWRATSKNTFKVGGRYEHTMIGDDGTIYHHSGEYKEITPPHRLVFTWTSDSVKDTLVTLEFEDKGDYTELTLTHDVFPSDDLKAQHSQGWQECLISLTKYLENMPQ